MNAGEATRLLRQAGEATGESALSQFADSAGSDPTRLDRDGFWTRLGSYFEAQGWGDLKQVRVHPGLGLMRSAAWAESEPEGDAGEASCAFTAGMLSGILSRVAEAPISVLEVRCRTRGDSDCSFVFGSDQAVRRLEGLLEETESLEAALERL